MPSDITSHLNHISPETSQVIVVGSANLDRVYRVRALPEPGETVVAADFFEGVGGKGANQAAAAALIGARTRLIAHVGNDPSGTFITSTLAEFGVDTSSIRHRDDAPTGNAAIAVDHAGENNILVASGANARMTPEDVAAALGDTTPRQVLLTQGELSAAVIDSVATLAEQRRLTLMLNLAPFVPLPRETLAAASIVIVNETEARDLAHYLQLVNATGGVAIDALGARLAHLIEATLIVTLGADGAHIFTVDGTAEHVPGTPVDQVVDTTGAGDSFVGVFAAAIAAEVPLRAAVSLASFVASETVKTAGAASSYSSKAALLARA